ncbi:hypothetical protein PTI45_01849 [Paenibacillus nuruki]|uniref:Phage protein n=1 Tax=Paenibacillus nuruki TaxID=1886670 RepID=A0A1E3L5K2_9BACL|nr:hypothetical protein [Paenibacillus nuruki]ODP28871.1 hypothetical protein PTI45_01849 [Paenibacillus nuruki]CAJ1316071.1 PepSY domain-containing protein [Paenibacillus nuruki]
MSNITKLAKLIKMTGDRAKLDAKMNNTYIVYKNKNGHIVKEYIDGNIVLIHNEESSYE